MSTVKYTKLMPEEEDGLDFGSIFSYERVGEDLLNEKDWKRRATDYVSGKRFRQNNLARYQDEGKKGNLPSSIAETGLIMACYFLFAATLPFSLIFSLKFVKQFERAVVFRLGRLQDAKGPGAVLILPCIDSYRRVDLRTKAFNVPPLQAVTRDQGLVELGATVYYRIKDALSAVNSVQDWNGATRTLAHTTIHRKMNKKYLSDVEKDRKQIGYELSDELNRSTFSWGMEITEVELSEVKVLKEANETGANQLLKSLSDPKVAGNLIQQFMKMGFDQSQAGPAGLKAFEMSGDWSNANAILPSGDVELTEVVVDKGPLVMTENMEFDLEKLLAVVRSLLSEQLVAEVGHIYHINCIDLGLFHLDLQNGAGRVGRGPIQEVDPSLTPHVTLSLTSKDMMELMLGEINPLRAFMSGRISLEGETRVAMKLEVLAQHLSAKYATPEA